VTLTDLYDSPSSRDVGSSRHVFLNCRNCCAGGFFRHAGYSIMLAFACRKKSSATCSACLENNFVSLSILNFRKISSTHFSLSPFDR
jgi:hypothetical protein